MVQNRSHEFRHTLALRSDGFKDLGPPAVFGVGLLAHVDHGDQVLVGAVNALPVGFVDDKEVANLQDAGLNGLDIISHARDGDHNGGMGGAGDLHLVLAHAHGLHQDKVFAHGIQDVDDGPGRGGESPEMPSGGQGADENAFISGVALHPDAVPQDGAAGKGLVGSTATTPTVWPCSRRD